MKIIKPNSLMIYNARNIPQFDNFEFKQFYFTLSTDEIK